MSGIEITNLILVSSSLIIAVIALIISYRLTKKSISKPFVIEKLYELYEYRKKRVLDTDIEKDIQRLISEVGRVNQMSLILEQAGFGNTLKELNDKRSVYSKISNELQEVLETGNQITDSQSEKIYDAAISMDKTLQKLLNEIEGRLRIILKDPIKEWM